MSALLWLWIGGMAPVALIAWSDHRLNGDVRLRVHVAAVVLWPLFAADSALALLRGKR